jgi:hypothetical protein
LPQIQTISLNPISNITHNSISQMVTISNSASSGLVVGFNVASNPNGIASLSSNVTILSNVGKLNVTSTQAGNSAYLATSSVTHSFSVLIATGGTPSTSTGTNLATVSGLQVPNLLSNTATTKLGSGFYFLRVGNITQKLVVE